MAASGWFLTIGAIRLLTREPLSLKLMTDVAAGQSCAPLAVAAALSPRR